MSEKTATFALEAIDRDKLAVRSSVAQILHILHDYIPRACLREAEEELFKAFFVNGVELTSNDMRKQYEEWKKHALDVGMLMTNKPFVPFKE